MVSKKLIAPALAGTGAAGASGVLSWALSLFDGEDLKSNVEEKKEAQDSTNDKSPKKPDTKPQRKITYVSNDFFTDGGGSSSVDRGVIDSKSTLKVELKTVMQSLIVSAEGGSWSCTLTAISIEVIYSGYDFTEFERQRWELEDALKEEKNKKQLVANCSNTRLANEKPGGNSSTINLEAERAGSWNKFKFKEEDEYFKRLWTENFYGVDRIKKEDEWFLEGDNVNAWNIKTEEETGTTIKITATLPNESNKKWICNISGNYTGDLGTRTFKDKNLKEILKFSTLNSSDIEKKKYLIRNCRKNNWEIKGLKIKKEGSNQWDFDETSLKKISEGMYENPTTTT